jgi:hypothetical protein
MLTACLETADPIQRDQIPVSFGIPLTDVTEYRVTTNCLIAA